MYLSLGGSISEIKGLDNLTNLIYLDLKHNQIPEIKGLEHLQSLKRLNLMGNQISEIKGLESLKRLIDLEFFLSISIFQDF